jgi:streptomycin 6-kinase
MWLRWASLMSNSCRSWSISSSSRVAIRSPAITRPERVTARRVDQFAEELGLDRKRVRDWGMSQAVLSVWWDIEDTGHVSDDMLACAELLAAIKF